MLFFVCFHAYLFLISITKLTNLLIYGNKNGVKRIKKK